MVMDMTMLVYLVF